MTTIKKIDPRIFLKLNNPFRSKPEFNFYSDPGHAWVQCSKDIAGILGFIDKISTYSFHDRDHYYLEEDQDAALLINALNDLDQTYKFNEIHEEGDSFVRSFPYVGSK
jgi:hypothetical protein